MRQLLRPEAFDQRHLNIHSSNWLWKRSAASRQIFKKHKPKLSEQSISEICYHSADLCVCALTLHILAHFEDISGQNPRLQEQTPFWGMRVQSGPYIRMEETTEGTWLCRRVAVLCCNRQLALDHSHAAKDRLPFLQTSGHFRRMYNHFFCLCCHNTKLYFLLHLHLPPTQSKAFLVPSCILSPQQQDL